MTPLEIEILFHYHCRAVDYRDADFSAPAVRAAMDRFTGELGLLELEKDPSLRRTWRPTDRAEVYLEHLMSQPLPVKTWVIPTIVEEVA